MRQDDGLRQQYDARLLQELQQSRAQNEQEMQLLREEIAGQYEKKVDETAEETPVTSLDSDR